jgi:hypothetical protein
MFLAGRFLVCIPQRLQIKSFYPLSCPWCFSQKSKTGFDRRVVSKASDRNSLTKFRPAVGVHEMVEYRIQPNSVKGVVLLRFQCQMNNDEFEVKNSGSNLYAADHLLTIRLDQIPQVTIQILKHRDRPVSFLAWRP